MKKIAIICANGIGDFLLMSLLAYNAKKACVTVLFHPLYQHFITLFPSLTLADPSSYQPDDFSLTLVQNDHSKMAYMLNDLRKNHANIYFIFPKYSPLQKEGDFFFDQNKTFTDNLLDISEKLFGHRISYNGIEISQSVKKNKQEVLIHPFSKNPKKNIPDKKLLAIYAYLEKKGLNPKIIMSEKEKENFPFSFLNTVTTPSIYALAHRISQSEYFIGCDSGPGHLASNLQIPTLSIMANPKIAKVWSPCYFFNLTVTPLFILPRIKLFKERMIDRYWHKLISMRRIKKTVDSLLQREEKSC